jgi:hypothetical protein
MYKRITTQNKNETKYKKTVNIINSIVLTHVNNDMEIDINLRIFIHRTPWLTFT